MSISYPALLKKLEQELLSAKAADGTSKMREHVYSMKTLCELILENGEAYVENAPAASARKIQNQMPMQMPLGQEPIRNVQIEQSKPLSTEDGANGDSIFDF